MTMRTTLKVDGLKDIEQALLAMKKSTAKGVMRRVGMRALQPMRATAEALAPDDVKTSSPDLHSSIIVSSKQKTGRSLRRAYEKELGLTVVNTYMGPTSFGYPQAITQEFGTIHHPAHPYMRPAWDQHAMPMLNFVGGDMWREISKTTKRLEARARRLAVKG